MKTKLLRLLSIILVLLLFVTVVGCSNSDDPNGTEETGASETVDEEDQDETSESQAPEEDEDDEDEEGQLTILDEISTEGGIKDVYEQVDMIAGTCLATAMINDEKYTNTILENFNTITLENDMKPEATLDYEASIDQGDIVVKFPDRTISLLNWAKENGLSVRGHTLVWYSQTPDWIFYEDFDTSNSLVDRDTMLERMENYIKQTFELIEELGFTDMFYAYDVVNEAILDNGSLRDCYWLDIIGDDYIWYAFYYADKYAPDHIKLYYNDFNEQFKTRYIVDLANSLVDEDGEYLIDGIGCQGHLYTQDSISSYIHMLRSFEPLGLDVQITELDISLGSWQNIQSATEENLLDQGQYYYELISTIIKENDNGNTNVSGITFWGFADNLSWRRDRSPLLFDSSLNPKYSYYGAKLDKDNAGY